MPLCGKCDSIYAYEIEDRFMCIKCDPKHWINELVKAKRRLRYVKKHVKRFWDQIENLE